MLKRIKSTSSYIKSKINFDPEFGIILGSGLGSLADCIEVVGAIDYKDIPDFPVSTIEGHKGRMIFGYLGEKKVVAMQGRFHYYEGYEPWQVVFPVRVMKLLGIKYLFVSNAAGGSNPDYNVGDLMVITDQINLIPNPLIGPNIAELGPRFPAMNNAYNPELIEKATAVAKKEGIQLRYGCYVGGTGPSYETQKEYRYFNTIGADAVGMSTTPEVIVARHMDLKVFGVSVITNCGLSNLPPTHEEVQIEGDKAAKKLTKLFIELLRSI